MRAALLALATAVSAHSVINRAGQTVFDDDVHPEWKFRQAALGWAPAAAGDTVLPSGGVGGCGGVCVLTPEAMEGPFYLDKDLHRANITEASPGLPLRLSLSLYQVRSHLSTRAERSTCEPLGGAWVDIWSCDAEGVYSGYGNASMPPGGGGGPGGPRGHGGPGRGPPGDHKPGDKRPGGGGHPDMHKEPTTNATFLRGVQQSDENGLVVFDTIYPGWYAGRTFHIHLKVHAPSWDDPATHNDTHAHTTQLFFPDAANDHIATLAPYRSNGARRMANEDDGLFKEMAGASVVSIEWVGGAGPDAEDVPWTGTYGAAGAKASLAIGVDKWW
ncbi:hypothetical protein Q5752_002169 [Cryptotrichosporon argae]